MSLDKQTSSESKKSCAIIGSGIAGIASSIRLAHKGIQVDVFEAQDSPGGKLSQFYSKGYRFDMGPTVLTLPHLIDELFTLCGKDPKDYFNHHKLERPFKYFFEDGSTITAFAEIEKYAEEITLKTNESSKAFRDYLSDVARKYELLNDVFIENSLHVFENYLSWKAAKGLINIGQIDAFKTMDQVNQRFFTNPKFIQILNKCANYVGSNPFVAPGTLNVIQHLEINLGVYFPRHGMYDIVTSLVRLAEEMGVRFHYKKMVERIVVENKTATGLKVGNDIKTFDRVISNMDIYHTYRRLMPDQTEPKFSIKQQKSSSCVAFYWGISRKFDELEMHNMLFTQNEKLENDTLFNDQNIYDDPSIYIGITSKQTKEDAPDGCENWFVMVSAPNNQGQDWDHIKSRTRINVIRKINRLLNTDIEQFIETEHILTPPMIETRYLSVFGAPYGASSNKRLSAFLRHPNFSSKIKHLYFVGGTVHPGAGVPMSLNSAKIMDKLFK